MKYFTEDEFKCKCGRCGRGFKDMRPELLNRLEKAREIAKVGFVISSAVRCKAHNEAEGGVSTSSHLHGWAVDIKTPTSYRRSAILKGLIEAGFTRIGIAGSFIHVDCDPTKVQNVTWTY